MNPENPPIELDCLALASLRQLRGVRKKKLADHTGINASLLSKHETSLPPAADRLDLLLEELDFTRRDHEEVRAAFSRVVARASCAPELPLPAENPLAASPVDPTPEEWREIHALAVEAGREAAMATMERLAEAVRESKAAAARTQAAEICGRLEKEPMPWLVVAKVREVQTWAVAEALAHRSADIATDRIDQAKELAALAYRVAELAPYTGPFRESLLGYTLFHGENALRAACDLPEAEAHYVSAEEHWKAGAAVPGPLQEWRLQGLASALHRDQRRFTEALARIDASLAAAPAEARGRLLVHKSLTLQQMGEPERAIELLEEAEKAVDREGDRRTFLIARFNRARLLCRLRRHAEAMLLLQEIESLAEAEEWTSGLNHARLLWLRGSLAAGLGRWDEAEAHLNAARRVFADRRVPWELAQVSLEQAVLLCRHGRRTHEVRKLTRGLAWIIEGEKLSLEALAALRLISDIPESALTLELAERALLLLQGAPRGKGLEKPPRRPEERPAEPSVVLAARGNDGAVVARPARVNDAAAVQRLAAPGGIPEAGRRGPEGGDPGDQPLHETGGLLRGGRARRQEG